MALLFASETLLREESETFETFSLDEIEQKNSLSNAYSSTRYRQISSSSSRLDNDEYVALIDVFDSAGQEEYSSMRFVSTWWLFNDCFERDQYYRTSNGFLLIYSITDPSSLEDCRQIYEQILRIKDADTYPMVLVGNKVDLGEERAVSREEGQQMAERLGISFCETSAKMDINVQHIFHELVRLCGRESDYKFAVVGSGGVGKSA